MRRGNQSAGEGAAIIHLHVYDEDGRPVEDADLADEDLDIDDDGDSPDNDVDLGGDDDLGVDTGETNDDN